MFKLAARVVRLSKSPLCSLGVLSTSVLLLILICTASEDREVAVRIVLVVEIRAVAVV